MTAVQRDVVILPTGLTVAEERVWLTLAIVRFERGEFPSTAKQQGEDMRLVATRLIADDNYREARSIKKRKLRANSLVVTDAVLRIYERMHPDMRKGKK